MTPSEISAQIIEILKQPAQPFPVFQNQEGQAYTYIKQQLGYDPRAEYGNNVYSISSIQNQINDLAPAPGLSNEVWKAVLGQLNTELDLAGDIRNLFSNFTSFCNSVFIDSGNRLNYVVNLVEASQSDNSGLSIFSIFGNVLNFFSYIPAPDGVNAIAGLLGMINTAMQNSGNFPPINAEVADLWNNLNSDFEGMQNQIGNAEQALVSDWGKMNAFSTLAKTGNLVWPADTGDFLITAGMGYELSFWQALMPIQWGVMSINTDGSWKLEQKAGCSTFIYMDQGKYPYWICRNQNFKWWWPPSEAMWNRLTNPLDIKSNTSGLGISLGDLLFNWNLPMLIASQGEPDVPSCLKK